MRQPGMRNGSVRRRGGLLALCFAALSTLAFATTAQQAVSKTAQEAGTADAGADTSPRALDMRAPDYPEDMAWRGIDGNVVMILGVDVQGTVSAVEIETSSGSERLDAVAVERARQWRFTPARRNGTPVVARVRVPVDFKIPPQYALDRVTGRPRDAYFDQRREGAAPLPPPLETPGTLPGYIADLLPIGVQSVAEGERMLARYAFREADAVPNQVLEYTLRDEEGLSVWNVVREGRFPKALVRRRLVGSGDISWDVSSLLCEGDAQRCAVFEAYLQTSVPAQQAQSALPELPPLREQTVSP